MSELSRWFNHTHRYLISYTAYAGYSNEYEIQGENCRIVSDRLLTDREIAEEVAHHIQEQDRIPVSQVVLRQIGPLAA
ncbi:hypothetical protein H6F67_27035 [Microcoleus sp. FACHB-1515]|uniref:hypothetical protein n=1 Tax=Cyanophyceae TaxID=3028117 RepID=UPI001688D679|nr:hypothetical protein [Microcoleus sp. FACHB-1515]MBD2093496.1 hypothetical protein [Microcoleus sp. FACHB-1515]